MRDDDDDDDDDEVLYAICNKTVAAVQRYSPGIYLEGLLEIKTNLLHDDLGEIPTITSRNKSKEKKFRAF
jgi:hypothetical protein